MKMKMTKAKRAVVVCVITIAAVCGALLALRAGVRSVAEFTETRMKIADLAGADLEITDTYFDMFAHDEWVSVYIDKSHKSYIERLIHRRALLFQYDPGADDAALPTITSPAPDRIHISLPAASSILYERKQWGSLSVDYKIGHVDYPR